MTNHTGKKSEQSGGGSRKPQSAGILKKDFNTYSLEPEVKIILNKDTYDKIIDALTKDPLLQAFLPIRERDERTNQYFDTKKKFHLFSKGAECRGREKKAAVPASTGVAARMAVYKYDLKTPRDVAKPEIGPDKHGLVIRGERSHKETHHIPRLSWFTHPEAPESCNHKPPVYDDAKAADSEISDLRGYLGEEMVDKKLVPWAGGTFQRHITEMSVSGSTIEVAFEKGRFHNIEGTEESDEFYVIELESKGENANLDHLIEAITRLKTVFKDTLGVDLEASGKTKGEMAFEWLYEANLMPEDVRPNFEQAQQDRQKLFTPARKLSL